MKTIVVTAEGDKGKGPCAAFLKELPVIGIDECCSHLVLDIAATNTNAQRFYKREGLVHAVIGIVKPLESIA